MDMPELSDLNFDLLLQPPIERHNAVTPPYEQVPLPGPPADAAAGEKKRRLAERIAQVDELVQQVKQLQEQNRQMADMQSTAQEVTELYQREKEQRVGLEERFRELSNRNADLENRLDVQVATCENLQEELLKRGLPVDAKDVLSILMQLSEQLGGDGGLGRRDFNILKKLKEHCKTMEIAVPSPKCPSPRSKSRKPTSHANQSTQTDPEPVKKKPVLCSVAVQAGRVVETRNQGTQHKKTTTTRGTTTASFITKHDVGTSFPEPKAMPNVHEILDEMLSWRIETVSPLSPLRSWSSEEKISSTVSVSTCTSLCDIYREIDYISERPSQIKVSASRPPSRTMLDSVKEEARYPACHKELARELLNILPQNQSCLPNLPAQVFDELWQVFGQMVLGLLQRRSTPASVSQADFASWLHEIYENTQGQNTEATAGTKGKNGRQNLSFGGLIQSTFLLDFACGPDSVDPDADTVVASSNISNAGDVTPIRLPLKPTERKPTSEKPKKRKATCNGKTFKKCRLDLRPQKLDKESGTQKISAAAEYEKGPETAIQFLSNLNTFNMANCDNFNMELDEQEKYLLQLTTNVRSQHKHQETSTEEMRTGTGSPKGPFQPQVQSARANTPAVQEEKDSSFKDDAQKPEETKATNNFISYGLPEQSDTQSQQTETTLTTEEQLILSSLKSTECGPIENGPETKGASFTSLFGSDSESSDGELSPPPNLGLGLSIAACEDNEKGQRTLPKMIQKSTFENNSDFKYESNQVNPGESYSSSDEEACLIIDEDVDISDLLDEQVASEKPFMRPKPSKMQTQSVSASPVETVRLTRLRVKQMLTVQEPRTDVRASLVEQIQGRLKQASVSDEDAKLLEPNEKSSEVHTKANKIKINQTSEVEATKPGEQQEQESYFEQSCEIIEISPASPIHEPIEMSYPVDIPLEQSHGKKVEGELTPLLHYVIQMSKRPKKGKKAASVRNRLNATIARFIKELTFSCSDFAIEIYRVTKDEAQISDAIITLTCESDVEDCPLRLINALQYLNLTDRFLSEIELRLFANFKDRPEANLSLKYVKLYLRVAAMRGGYENPTRLLLAKIIYHFDRDMPILVMELLTQFPTLLPHREQRAYDHGDPLITVIKHILMHRVFDLHDPEGPERLLLSKLRFQYHFAQFEPTGPQVLDNLIEKLKAERLEHLGYAFALFCRRSSFVNVAKKALDEQLMPLAASFCDLAGQDEAYDARLQTLVQCISMVLKPLPLDTDLSAYLGLFRRLLVAVPRPGVQQSVVQAVLRLQRFGYHHAQDTLHNYRPNYPLEPLTRAMLRSYAERRNQFQFIRNNAKATRGLVE
ncbi:hypothetical protein KR018_010834 [Drosophila ironensis]|nr:hypothetical protein KR018_010834 [Drosophila ironensis]